MYVNSCDNRESKSAHSVSVCPKQYLSQLDSYLKFWCTGNQSNNNPAKISESVSESFFLIIFDRFLHHYSLLPLTGAHSTMFSSSYVSISMRVCSINPDSECQRCSVKFSVGFWTECLALSLYFTETECQILNKNDNGVSLFLNILSMVDIRANV